MAEINERKLIMDNMKLSLFSAAAQAKQKLPFSRISFVPIGGEKDSRTTSIILFCEKM